MQCDKMINMRKIIIFLSAFMMAMSTYAVPAYTGTSIFERRASEEKREERGIAVGEPSAEQSFVRGDYEEALRIVKAVLSRRPKNDEKIQCLMGRALLKLNKLDEARDYFLKVAEESRDKKFLAEANIGIADSYYLDGEYRQARDYYEKVARSYPDADSMNIVYYRLGECYSKLDNAG